MLQGMLIEIILEGSILAERVLALVLFVLGGGITLYILYKTALAVLEPMVQKKMEQKFQRDKMSQANNSLKVGEQLDPQKVRENKMK